MRGIASGSAAPAYLGAPRPFRSGVGVRYFMASLAPSFSTLPSDVYSAAEKAK